MKKTMNKTVIKIGTSVLTSEDGSLAVGRLSRILDEIFPFMIKPHQQIYIVSSGAVGLGRMRLGFNHQLSLSEKQACAAVGQSILIQNYNVILSRFGLMAGQVLLSSEDLKNTRRRKNLLASLKEMERFSVIPVINENDVTSTVEIESADGEDLSFGDNDRLSALLSLEIGAQLLVMLTESDGIYLQKPMNREESPIGVVKDLNVLQQVKAWGSSQWGRGGVESKISSLSLAAQGGVSCWVTSGFKEGQLHSFFAEFTKGNIPQGGTFVIGKESEWNPY